MGRPRKTLPLAMELLVVDDTPGRRVTFLWMHNHYQVSRAPVDGPISTAFGQQSLDLMNYKKPNQTKPNKQKQRTLKVWGWGVDWERSG